jgi:hypothetical protein
MIYDSRAIELKDFLLNREALEADGWECVIPFDPEPMQPVVYIRKPRPDLTPKD